VLVVKLVDLDGDPETLDDQETAAGFEFSYEVAAGATITDSEDVTDDEGIAWFEISLEGESTDASITELVDDPESLIDVECVAVEEGEGGQQFFDVPVELDGTTASFEVFDGELVECFFVNAADTAGATPTPSPTPVPTPAGAATPTLPASSTDAVASGNGGSSIALVVLLLGAGAAGLFVMAPSTRRLRR
jgi:hypothetical protein